MLYIKSYFFSQKIKYLNVIYDRFLFILHLMATFIARDFSFQFSVFLIFIFYVFICIFFVNKFLNTSGIEKWLIKSAKFMRNWYSCIFVRVCFATQISKNWELWFICFYFGLKEKSVHISFYCFFFILLILLISCFDEIERERERDHFIAIGRIILMKFDARLQINDRATKMKARQSSRSNKNTNRRMQEMRRGNNSICHACSIIGHTRA